MKNVINVILAISTVFSLCIISYVRLGIGFPIWHSDNYQNYNIVFENLSYSYLAGILVYLLTLVLPALWESYRLKPIINKKIGHLAELFNKQLLGFGIPEGKEGFYQFDSTKIEECLSIMDKADWNAANPVVNNIPNNKLYQTYKQDLDAIILEIADILQTYKDQLSQDDIQHLENIRQADIITYMNVFYSANVVFSKEGQKFVVEGHKKLLEEYNKLLQDRKITLTDKVLTNNET